jgi:hypothetical protein
MVDSLADNLQVVTVKARQLAVTVSCCLVLALNPRATVMEGTRLDLLLKALRPP